TGSLHRRQRGRCRDGGAGGGTVWALYAGLSQDPGRGADARFRLRRLRGAAGTAGGGGMRLTALIVDVDGTLAETEELHRAAFNAAFAAAGLGWHWSVADYARLLTTTGGKERIARFRDEVGAPAIDIPALHADKTARYAAGVAAGGVRLRPGIAELMAMARAGGLRLAVATTTSRPNVEALTLSAFGRGAAAVFDVLACGDEVAAKKPAPDVYILALERLGLAPEQALAF